MAKDSRVGVRTPAENRKDNLQAEYWSRLNDQMVLCRVLWDEPATNSVMRVIVSVPIPLGEIEEPRLESNAAETLRESPELPTDYQLEPVALAQALARRLANLNTVGGWPKSQRGHT